jgi:hypothetical protein
LKALSLIFQIEQKIVKKIMEVSPYPDLKQPPPQQKKLTPNVLTPFIEMFPQSSRKLEMLKLNTQNLAEMPRNEQGEPN